MDNLHIVSVATDPIYYFPYLVESCKKNGKELTVLGMGEKWKGFNWKYLKMIEYLKNIPPKDIVCFVDGYDVVCTRHLSKLKDTFIKIKKKTNCKIVVGHDKINNYSIFKIFHSIFFKKCNNASINSGTYIGYAKDILHILKKIHAINNINNEDDQILLINYCLNNPTDIYIDIYNELFLTLLYPLCDLSNHVSIYNNKLSYNNNEPFFIHAPGYGILDNILIKLNYNYTHNIKSEYYNEIIKKKFWHYFKAFIYNNPIISFFITIVVILFILGLYFSVKNIYKVLKNNKKYKKYLIYKN